MDSLTNISPSIAGTFATSREKPKDLEAAAEQFEALFIHQLLKQARSAKLADDIFGSQAGESYESMLDQERAKHLSMTMDLGIAEALISQFRGFTAGNSGE